MKTDDQEERGIEAIIYLQSLAGIKETREAAVKGWRGMSEREQMFTLQMAENMKANN